MCHIFVSKNASCSIRCRLPQRKNMFITFYPFLAHRLEAIFTFVYPSTTGTHTSIVCVFVALFTPVFDREPVERLLVLDTKKSEDARRVYLHLLIYLNFKPRGPPQWEKLWQAVAEDQTGGERRRSEEVWESIFSSFFADYRCITMFSRNKSHCVMFALSMAATWAYGVAIICGKDHGVRSVEFLLSS